MVFSKPEYRTYLEEAVFEGFPDYTVEHWTVFTTYHWGTLIEWTFSGTHEGNAGDTKPTGRKITLPLVSIVTMSDEGITTWMDFFDSDRLDEQLGRILTSAGSDEQTRVLLFY